MWTRRGFLASGSALSYAQIKGANERVRIGLMGCGGRGVYDARFARQHGNAEIVALADVYGPRIDNARKTLNEAATAYGDFRALLERKDIDAVVVGAPDHWHAPMTIAAVEAGKDVYVEKPLTHSVEEGARVIEAVRKSGRIVQVGYQQRSFPHMAEARELIRAGRIGKVTQVLTWWNQNLAAAKMPEVDVAKLDWKGFQGNACPRPFSPWRYGDWRWFWDYGNGTMTDLFSHWIDVAHWVMGESVPLTVSGQGANQAIHWCEAPDTVSAALQYPGRWQASYVSTMVTGMEDGGILFRGTEGALKILRPCYELYLEGSPRDPRSHWPAPEKRVDQTREGTIDHVLNWLDCVKSRKQPNAPVETSVDSANAAHWANEAIRSGLTLNTPPRPGAWRALFNGRDLEGWAEDTPGVWKARDGMIVGKHTGQKWNDFLRTREHFDDFELELEFRLADGVGNSGVQFRSLPAEKEHELAGYQADIGEKYWGSLYDESRRNRTLVEAPAEAIARIDKSGWHTYAVRALGNHITLTLDGMRTVNYTEPERGILRRGLIALQVHSGPGITVEFRNLRVRELGAWR
jgi:predicted dehydrogenase